MNKIRLTAIMSLLMVIVIMLSTGCSDKPADLNLPEKEQTETPTNIDKRETESTDENKPGSPSDSKESSEQPDQGEPTTGKSNHENMNNNPSDPGDAVQVVAEPHNLTVLVNKTFRLPEGHKPDDLVYPDVPFIFDEKLDKRKMRKEAAEALEKLFAAAKEDEIHLAGASGYRSQETQKDLFNSYVNRDGLKAASKYSARPGHSEHQTGLAMDVSGITGKCAVQDCFAEEKEAKWLAEHAAEHGFIIRYLKGKESITGYQYEPWHLRYVGTAISKEIAEQGIALEEYYDNTVPVMEGRYIK